MMDRDRATDTLRHRLAELLSTWDAELSEETPSIHPPHGDTRRGFDAGASALREKERLIAELEERVRRYTEAIIELKHSEDTWRRKYLDLAAVNIDPDATSTELQLLEDGDVPEGLAEPRRQTK